MTINVSILRDAKWKMGNAKLNEEMTRKNLIVITLLVSALTAIIHEAESAVATAKVTAKVVPASSFHISQRIALSIPGENSTDTPQQKTNTNRIEISALTNKTAIKVQTKGAQNTIYDLSISSASTLTNASADSIKIHSMMLNSDTPPLTGDHEQEALLGGVLTKQDNQKPGSYSGTTEITVNYN